MLRRILLIILGILLIFNPDIFKNYNESTLPEQSAMTENGKPDKISEYTDFLSSTKKADINYGDIVFERYDASKFYEKADFIKDNCNNSLKTDQVCEAYDFLYRELEKISTYSEYSYIEYAKDVTNKEANDDYLYTERLCIDMSNAFDEAVICLVSSSYKDEFSSHMGQGIASLYEHMKDKDLKRIAELEKKELELENTYLDISAQTHTAIYNDEEWTFDRLVSDNTLNADEYYEIADLIFENYNSKVVGIYIELVEVRKQIAEEYGYDSYAEYCYENTYSRGYTPEEIKRFHSNVKDCIVKPYNDIYFSTFLYGYGSYYTDADDIISVLDKYIPSISKDMNDALINMKKRQMYCLSTKDTSTGESFSTMLPLYGQPYIFCSANGNQYDIQNMIHEFGHYCNFYLNEQKSLMFFGDDFDSSEVHSQGLEMLFLEYYDEIYGDEAIPVKAEFLTTALNTIIDGSMYDEAQQRIFEYDGELTCETVNEIFRSTALEYGKSSSFDNGYSWVEITHTFTAPFYYISYAAAQIAALEIWLESELNGHDAAIDMYLEFCSYSAEENTITDILSLCSMRNFTDKELLLQISDVTCEKIYELHNEYTGAYEDAA